jgi:transcriptional regulator with XRE-family HTH domain
MFQPTGSQDLSGEAGEAARKAKPAPEAPAVDPSLRAGPKLAQARELKGLSLDEIAAKIHVRRDYLEALEAMNLKLLPGSAYARAYLKSYAKVLGLDAEAILNQFTRESALTREDAKPQLRNPESKPGRERPWLAALAIGLALAGFVGWRAWEGTRQGDPRLRTAEAPVVSNRAVGSYAPSAAPAPNLAQVEIKALSEAWLEVRGPDGTIFLSRTLQAGDRYYPEPGAGWTLHARDGSAFEVSIDGQVIGQLGEAGKPVLGRRVDTIADSVSIAKRPVAARPAAPAAAAPQPRRERAQSQPAAPAPRPPSADGPNGNPLTN